MKPTRCLSAILLSILWGTVACVHTQVAVTDHSIPDGFARYTKAKEVKAVSPEGVVYRVRDEDNKPYADLPFWKEALKKRMLDAGYIFLREAPIAADIHKGYLLELTAPFGQQDYSYLIAIFIQEKKILIVEAAGEVTQIAGHREAILAAISHLSF
jgi:hypothetical protein